MAGDGADSALGGAPVGKHGGIGHAEEGFYPGIRDIVGKDKNARFPGQGINLRLVFVERTIGLPGNDQLVVFRQVPEGIQQNVQAFVVPDEPKEKQGFLSGVHPQFACGFLPRKGRSKMGINGMGKEDMRRLGTQG